MTGEPPASVIEHKQFKKRSIVARLALAVGAVIVVLVLLAIGFVPRLARSREALAASSESPVLNPTVSVVQARPGRPESELLLPGNIQPRYSAAIYARTEGYLQQRYVDIGSRVKAGQILAQISAPEVDQQLSQGRAALAQSRAALKQARAGLEQAKANAELARLTKERNIPLGQQRAISQQAVDEAIQAHQARIADVAAADANITAAEATVEASEANVARLEELKIFQRIVAPFDGVITERNIEQGDLVTTGPAAASKPLFTVAQSEIVRVQVDVPQSQAVNIRNGQTAAVSVRERVGRTYRGTVVRSAEALDDAARTMRTEVQVDNRDGSLLPGMYAEVRFTLAQQRPVLIIPTSSLVVDQSGQHVAIVRGGDTLHFSSVIVGRHLGIDVEVLSGIDTTELVVANPNDLLQEGQKVKIRDGGK